MNPSEDRRKAGIFLLAALGALVATLGVLAGARFLSRDRTYVAEFRESVSGLEPSSAVKYNGVPVGTVSAIRFDPGDLTRILVEFTVRPEVPVKVNTRAQLKPQGITGIFYLELRGGTSDAPPLEEDAVIPSDPSLTAKIGGIAEDLSELVSRLNRFVEINEKGLSSAIENISASSGTVRATLEKVDRLVERVGGIGEQGSSGLAEARKAVEEIRTQVASVGEAARRTLAEIESFAKDPALRALPEKTSRTLDLLHDRVAAADVAGTLERVNGAVEEFRRIEESLGRAAVALERAAEGGRRDLSAAMENVRTATEHVKAAARDLRNDPSRLLRARPAVEKEIPDPLPPLPEERR